MGSPGFVISNYLPPMPALHTPLCDLLGCRYPVMQAPMAGGPTTPELVTAVCEAGGFGVIAAGRLTTDQLRETIHAVRRQTSRPFGVNFLLAPPEGFPLLAGQVGALCRPDQGGRDVMRDLVEQTVAVLERLGRLR